MVHEAAHVAQYSQRGVIRFLAGYLWDFTGNLTSQLRQSKLSLAAAYEEIEMEREARLAEAAFIGDETRAI
jgi:hypothetical protein